MKNLKRITAFILVFCLLMSATLISASAADTVKIEFKGTYDYSEAYKVLDIVNQERAKAGLSALTMDTDLLETAMQRAAECSIYFSHTRPDGSSCFTAFPSKFTYGSRGENIAIGQRNASAVMTSWMNSQGHKENILNSNFSSIGIGCFYQNGTLCWTQLFSSVKASSPSTRPTNKVVTASASILTDQLYLAYEMIEVPEPNVGQFILYNRNMEFYEDYIQLENTTITYTSDDPNILDITSSGLIKSTSTGTTKLRCYIEGTFIFELEMTYGHEHKYDAVITPPTCTERGYTTYTCTECGDSYINNITQPIGHDYKSVVTAPTCTTGGFTTYTCKHCGDNYVGNETQPTAHDYSTVVTKPTCTTGGYTTYTCKHCGDNYVGNRTEPAPHNYNAVVTKPTYTENGYTTYTCKDCGYSYVGDETPALTHNYVGVVTAPTCTSGGYTTYTCTDCGDSYVADRTDPIDHNYNSVVTKPTCTTGGFTTYTCKHCGDSYVGNRTEPVPHDYNAVVTKPTYTENGYTTYTCKDCGYSYVGDIVPALTHNYVGIVTEPTCTSGGYTTYTCTDCGDSYVGNETQPTAHNYISVVTKPTCTAGGYTTYTCTNCGDSYTTNGTAPISHDYKVTAIPNGYLYECKNCDHSYQETVTSKLPGDADGDGKVSNSDLIAVARYIVGLNTTVDITAADIDKSGNIANADLIAIARRLVGLE